MRENDQAIANISRARQALAKASTVDEVKNVKDVAAAAIAYARRRGIALEACNDAAELLCDAERRLGEMLAIACPVGRPDKSLRRVSISDLGISTRVSAGARKAASVPEQEYRRYIERCREGGNLITLAGLRKLSASAPKPSRPAEASKGQEVVGSIEELAGREFGTIYADPPWRYGNQSTRAATDNHYPTMAVDELCEMGVADLVADDAHLHLWTTNGFLFDAKRVIDAWGFEYKSCAVWCKPQMGIGNYVRVSHEFLLIAVKGSAKSFRERDIRSWFEIPRGKHSAKPDYWRGVIERNSPGPYLELFGRTALSGWTVLGNQVEATFL